MNRRTLSVWLELTTDAARSLLSYHIQRVCARERFRDPCRASSKSSDDWHLPIFYTDATSTGLI